MPAPRNAGRGVRRSKEEKEKAGKALRRLLADLFRRYPVHLILVVILIVISVLANVRGTLFIQTLIDGYINPMLKGNSRDFTPLLNAIRQVAAIYIVGILATYFYNLLMVYVNQGMLRMLRDKMFSHMESLPIRYFDTHAHGDIMSCYTNDIDTLRQMISQALPQMINASIMIAAVLVSMIYLSPVLTIITLGMTAVMIFVTGKAASISGRFYTQQQTDIGDRKSVV